MVETNNKSKASKWRLIIELAEISDNFLENFIDNSVPEKTKYGHGDSRIKIFNDKERNNVTYNFHKKFK